MPTRQMARKVKTAVGANPGWTVATEADPVCTGAGLIRPGPGHAFPPPAFALAAALAAEGPRTPAWRKAVERKRGRGGWPMMMLAEKMPTVGPVGGRASRAARSRATEAQGTMATSPWKVGSRREAVSWATQITSWRGGWRFRA